MDAHESKDLPRSPCPQAQQRPLVVGFGNPLLDLTIDESVEEVAAQVGLSPSRWTSLLDSDKREIVSRILSNADLCSRIRCGPGGSALNTCRVLASRRKDFECVFLGSMGRDGMGLQLRRACQADRVRLIRLQVKKDSKDDTQDDDDAGDGDGEGDDDTGHDEGDDDMAVTHFSIRGNQHTGVCVVCVEPKTRERSLVTVRGASNQVTPQALVESQDAQACLRRACVVYVGAYTITTPPRYRTTVLLAEAAKGAGAVFALNLSSDRIAGDPALSELIASLLPLTSLVICNAQEIRSFARACKWTALPSQAHRTKRVRRRPTVFRRTRLSTHKLSRIRRKRLVRNGRRTNARRVIKACRSAGTVRSGSTIKVRKKGLTICSINNPAHLVKGHCARELRCFARTLCGLLGTQLGGSNLRHAAVFVTNGPDVTVVATASSSSSPSSPASSSSPSSASPAPPSSSPRLVRVSVVAVPALPKHKLQDTNGAGDSFAAGVLSGWNSANPQLSSTSCNSGSSVQRANHALARVCATQGHLYARSILQGVGCAQFVHAQ